MAYTIIFISTIIHTTNNLNSINIFIFYVNQKLHQCSIACISRQSLNRAITHQYKAAEHYLTAITDVHQLHDIKLTGQCIFKKEHISFLYFCNDFITLAQIR